MIKVRKFNKTGLEAVRALLSEIRADNNLYTDRMTALLCQDNLTEEIENAPEIDLEKTFETKIGMINYFYKHILTDAVLDKFQKDAGFWTWLAIAYYEQFLKNRNGISRVATDYCWIFDPYEYRFSRRHFVAGTMYLYRDFRHMLGVEDGEKNDANGLDMFFAGEPYSFGGFLDAITYKEEFARIPAMLQIAVWLYYDPKSEKKIKTGASSQGKPGTIRELTRMVDQFALTYDIFEIESAGKLWNLLPSQFNGFKGDAKH